MMVTLSRLYANGAQARRVIDELKATGVAENDIGVVAPSRERAHSINRAAAVGALLAGTTGFLVGLFLFLLPDVGTLIAPGWLMGALMGAVGGGVAGGIIGALIEVGLSGQEAAHVTHHRIRRAGTLVSVRVTSQNRVFYERLLDAPFAVRQRALYEPGDIPVPLPGLNMPAIW